MKQFVTIGVFFIGLFLLFKFGSPISLSIQNTTTNKTDSFTVTGTGKVDASPDIAIVSAGVTTQAATVKLAQETLNQNINAVTKAIKSLGIDDKDIKTTNYSLYPQYDYRDGKQRLTSYSASSNITVKVRDLDKVNQVIDASTANGANQVGGVTFDVDDKTKLENQARQKAVTDAKTKASEAAKSAGFTLGRVINYSENFGDQPRSIYMMGKADSAPETTQTQIEPGSNEISVTVTLSYELR